MTYLNVSLLIIKVVRAHRILLWLSLSPRAKARAGSDIVLSYVYVDPALFLTFLTRSFYPSSGPIVVSFEFVDSRDFHKWI